MPAAAETHPGSTSHLRSKQRQRRGRLYPSEESRGSRAVKRHLREAARSLPGPRNTNKAGGRNKKQLRPNIVITLIFGLHTAPGIRVHQGRIYPPCLAGCGLYGGEQPASSCFSAGTEQGAAQPSSSRALSRSPPGFTPGGRDPDELAPRPQHLQPCLLPSPSPPNFSETSFKRRLKAWHPGSPLRPPAQAGPPRHRFQAGPPGEAGSVPPGLSFRSHGSGIKQPVVARASQHRRLPSP